jgi:hypothetical protein
MDKFTEPKEINNTCRKIAYIGTMDRGYTVI